MCPIINCVIGCCHSKSDSNFTYTVKAVCASACAFLLVLFMLFCSWPWALTGGQDQRRIYPWGKSIKYHIKLFYEPLPVTSWYFRSRSALINKFCCVKEKTLITKIKAKSKLCFSLYRSLLNTEPQMLRPELQSIF